MVTDVVRTENSFQRMYLKTEQHDTITNVTASEISTYPRMQNDHPKETGPNVNHLARRRLFPTPYAKTARASLNMLRLAP